MDSSPSGKNTRRRGRRQRQRQRQKQRRQEKQEGETGTETGTETETERVQVVKREPVRAPTAPWDVYVTTKMRKQTALQRIHTLLDDSPYGYAVVRGLGRTVTKAVDIALALQAIRGGPNVIALDVYTASVDLIDDLPDGSTRQRTNSSIAISIYPVPS